MKKVLSVILAIIMIASAVPMAFAVEECKHTYELGAIMNEGYSYCENCGIKSADFTECFESYVKLMGKAYSIGNSKINNETLLSRIVADVDGYDTLKLHRATEAEQAYVDKATKAVNDYIEALDEEFTIVYDATDLMAVVFVIEAKDFDNDDIAIFSDETLEKADEALTGYLSEIRNIDHGDSVDVAECIEKGKAATYYCTAILSCIEGDHQCDAFTDNGDGTHTSDCTFCNTKNIISEHEWGKYVAGEDGSKTAKCKYCDATDTDNFEKDIRDFFEMLINLLKSFIEAMFR